MVNSILHVIWYLLYLIDAFVCWLLQAFYEMFSIFAGTKKVSIGTSQDFLINVFFNNSTITIVFYGMLLIGFVMLFGFTIAAVIRKSFDLGDKIQQPLSEILRKALNSFIFMLCMNFIMSASIYATNTLMTSITYLFDNAERIKEEVNNNITFTEEDYAKMANIFDTIGSYAINPSSTSRYNVNSCFNSIRTDLQALTENHANFYNFTYTETGKDGQTVQSWQSILAQIARAHDLTTDQPLDEYSTSLSAAIDNAMEYVTVNKDNMNVLKEFKVSSNLKQTASSRLDVMMFLTATSEAANNENYNGLNASFYDAVRGPYLTGERDIYDSSAVEEDFSIALPEFKHFLLIICGCIMLAEFFEMAINAVARLFNMLLLYIISPPFIAVAPFDDGSRFKQWCTAFVIQTFSVFGSVISIRLFLVIIPIVMQSNLVLFSNGVMNMLAKLGLILAAGYTAHKASGMVGGIVGENAAQQAIFAGDVASSMEQGLPGKIAGGAGDLLAGTISGAWGGTKSLAKSGVGAIGEMMARDRATRLKRSMNDKGADGVRASKGFLNMDREKAKKQYGLDDHAYDVMRSRAQNGMTYAQQRKNFLEKVNGPNGAQEAQKFLNQDPDEAMRSLGLDAEQYNDLKPQLNQIIAAGGGNQGEGPVNNNAAEVNNSKVPPIVNHGANNNPPGSYNGQPGNSSGGARQDSLNQENGPDAGGVNNVEGPQGPSGEQPNIPGSEPRNLGLENLEAGGNVDNSGQPVDSVQNFQGNPPVIEQVAGADSGNAVNEQIPAQNGPQMSGQGPSIVNHGSDPVDVNRMQPAEQQNYGSANTGSAVNSSSNVQPQNTGAVSQGPQPSGTQVQIPGTTLNKQPPVTNWQNAYTGSNSPQSTYQQNRGQAYSTNANPNKQQVRILGNYASGASNMTTAQMYGFHESVPKVSGDSGSVQYGGGNPQPNVQSPVQQPDVQPAGNPGNAYTQSQQTFGPNSPVKVTILDSFDGGAGGNRITQQYRNNSNAQSVPNSGMQSGYNSGNPVYMPPQVDNTQYQRNADSSNNTGASAMEQPQNTVYDVSQGSQGQNRSGLSVNQGVRPTSQQNYRNDSGIRSRSGAISKKVPNVKSNTKK